jgi:hypothetical protein
VGATEQLQRREMLQRGGLGGSGQGGADPLDPSSYSDAPRCGSAYCS